MARKGVVNAGFTPDSDQTSTHSKGGSACQNQATPVGAGRDVEVGLPTADGRENRLQGHHRRESGQRESGPLGHYRGGSGPQNHVWKESGPQGHYRSESGPQRHNRGQSGPQGQEWTENGPQGHYKGHYRSKSGNLERIRIGNGPQVHGRRESEPTGHKSSESGPKGHYRSESGPWGHHRNKSGCIPPFRRENSAQSIATDLYDWYDAVGARDAWVQTESTPVTLSSWKILRTSQANSLDASTISSLSDYVVVETQATGFDVSVQTQDAHMFRYTDAQVSEMVIAWQMLTLFMPSTWYLLMYVADQVTSIIVASEMCSAGEQWWCGLTLTFLILPSIGINAYAYEQLVRPDIASVAPLNKWVARLLFALQVAPHYLLGRKVSWCFRAWRAQSWQSRRTNSRPPALDHKSPQVLWDQAKADTDSNTTKWFHSLFESVPQLSIQSYILMKLATPHASPTEGVVSPELVVSVVVSLASACAGLASGLSERAWERVAAATAIFLTLGSRVMVCSGIGTIHPALWFVPVASATFLGFITKISESEEPTYLAMFTKCHKYLYEAFIMASVCPPFSAVGLFSSAPYVLAGLCYLTLDPSEFFNILVFLSSIFGQILWLAVGFFVK